MPEPTLTADHAPPGSESNRATNGPPLVSSLHSRIDSPALEGEDGRIREEARPHPDTDNPIVEPYDR